MYAVLFKAVLIIAAFILSSFFPETVSLEGYGKHFDVTFAHVAAFLALLIIAADIGRRLYRFIHAWFVPTPEKRLKEGLAGVQACFEALLLNDSKNAHRELIRARRFLEQDLPLLLWFDGKIASLEGETHRAQSCFYALNAREEGRFLGSYGLYQIAQREQNAENALIALEGALEKHKDSELLLKQAFLLALQKKHFEKAREFLAPLMRKGLRESNVLAKQWEALSYFLEAQEAPPERKQSLLLLCANKAPEYTVPVVAAFRGMSPLEQRLRGRALLKRAWKAAPHPLLEEALKDHSASKKALERRRLLQSLFSENPESWLSFWGLGNLALEAGLWSVALQNFEDAYRRFPVRLVAEKAAESVKLLHPGDFEHLSEYLDWDEKAHSGRSWPVWTCSCCAQLSQDWTPFCRQCQTFASLTWDVSPDDKPTSGLLQEASLDLYPSR
ncbi:MAG: hypothetical protein LBJ70_03240 [Holosporales bacterium]|nr:hypothetical protein [Holosporales bacterium]